MADEKESKTISQLLARPVKRESIVITKWISIMVIGFTITSVDSLIIYLGLCYISNDLSILLNNLDVLFRVWIYLGLWFMVYGTIFLFIGILIDKNALGWGFAVAYFEAFFSQFIFGPLGGGNTPYSIANHINYVAAEFLLEEYLSFRIPDIDPIISLLICFGLVVLTLLLSLIVMRRKDFP
jgi:ABC-type transport system involved in multi-copper enzyme maturation permease subunit